VQARFSREISLLFSWCLKAHIEIEWQLRDAINGKPPATPFGKTIVNLKFPGKTFDASVPGARSAK
jgi:hypothetical protein